MPADTEILETLLFFLGGGDLLPSRNGDTVLNRHHHPRKIPWSSRHRRPTYLACCSSSLFFLADLLGAAVPVPVALLPLGRPPPVVVDVVVPGVPRRADRGQPAVDAAWQVGGDGDGHRRRGGGGGGGWGAVGGRHRGGGGAGERPNKQEHVEVTL